LFLVDTTAVVRGSVTLNVPNVDWEALAEGPCGPDRCLYIGDIGDNGSHRPHVTIFRVTEPADAALETHQATIRDSIAVIYSNGPRDAEALTVSPDGDAAIITKGWDGEAAAYAVPREAWEKRAITARSVWRFPLAMGILPGRLVTDAAVSPDGQTLAVRTYRDIHLFTKGSDSTYLPDHYVATCSVKGLEPLGEAIAWWNDSTLLLTSESTRLRPGPVTLLQCPAR